MALGTIANEVLSAVELCVSSREVDCVPSLLKSLTPCLSEQLEAGGSDRVRLHVHTKAAATSTKLAMPVFGRVAVFTDNQHDAVCELKYGSVQVGKVLHRPEVYDQLDEQGVSTADSIGLTTLRVSSSRSAADFSEEVLGMELLAVIAIDSETDQNIELYFYGFHRTVSNPTQYSILELDHTADNESVVVGVDHDCPHLAEISLGLPEIAFFAERVDAAHLEQAPIEQSVKRSNKPTSFRVCDQAIGIGFEALNDDLKEDSVLTMLSDFARGKRAPATARDDISGRRVVSRPIG